MLQTPEQQAMLAVLDRAPMGFAQRWYWLLSTGGTTLGGFSVFTLGVALPLLMQTFVIDATMQGLLGAALLFGAVPGSLLGGPLADRFGRKPLMILDMALITLGALICVFAGSADMLLVGLFIFGVGVGIDYPVGSAYVAEWMPIEARSRMMVATIAFQAVGFVLAAAMTGSVLWWVESDSAWRGFMLALAALPLLYLVLRLPLKESPRWLMGKGRNLDAARAIGAVVVADRAKLEALGKAAAANVHLVAKDAEAVKAQGMGALFGRSYRRRTTLACVPWFLMDIASYGIGLFTPLLLAELHFGKAARGPVAADFSDISGSSLIDLFLLIGFLVAFWVVPRYGHIRPQVLGFLGMAVGMLVLVGVLWTSGTAGPGAMAVFLGFVLFNLAMNIGPHSTTFALPAELFPTQLRGAGSGFASAAAKVGAALGAFLLPIIRAEYGLEAVLLLVAVVSLAGALVTAWLVEELGGAASLEDRHGDAIASRPTDPKAAVRSA
ncbi:MFS transporter [Kaistia defluvii]|uniref:MFS transporter n=1 Tax=Kaistia defluvii TaxID=410841 RepID=UPI00224CA549|nr:MFS transporter [Kaistia defluvii]MCX5516814.1 MFS transporter [Kaistia defluvii]